MARAKPIQISKFARYEGVELEVGIVQSHANDDPGTLLGVILQGGRARSVLRDHRSVTKLVGEPDPPKHVVSSALKLVS
jgi:hypothetical protein